MVPTDVLVSGLYAKSVLRAASLQLYSTSSSVIVVPPATVAEPTIPSEFIFTSMTTTPVQPAFASGNAGLCCTYLFSTLTFASTFGFDAVVLVGLVDVVLLPVDD